MDIRARLFLSSFLDRLRRDPAYGETLGLQDLSGFRQESPLPSALAGQMAETASVPVRSASSSGDLSPNSDPSQR